MPYLIDTNIAIHAVYGMDVVRDKLAEHDEAVPLSVLSLTELQRGVHKNAAQTALRRARLSVLLRNLPVLPFDAAAAAVYGQIIAQCGWIKGRDHDRMIAAHAITSGSVLVTNNVADFRDIPGLSWDNWTRRDGIARIIAVRTVRAPGAAAHVQPRPRLDAPFGPAHLPPARRLDGRCCRKTAEESPGSTGIRCRLTAGGGDPRDSATENKPPVRQQCLTGKGETGR